MQNKPKKLCFLRRWLFKGKSQHEKEKICQRIAIGGVILYGAFIGAVTCQVSNEEQQAQQKQAVELPAEQQDAGAELLSR